MTRGVASHKDFLLLVKPPLLHHTQQHKAPSVSAGWTMGLSVGTRALHCARDWELHPEEGRTEAGRSARPRAAGVGATLRNSHCAS